MVVYLLLFIGSAFLAFSYSIFILTDPFGDSYISQDYSKSHSVIEHILYDEHSDLVTINKKLPYHPEVSKLNDISLHDISTVLIDRVEHSVSDVILYMTLYEKSLELGHTYNTYPSYIDILYGVYPMFSIDRSHIEDWTFVLVTYPPIYYYYDNIDDYMIITYTQRYIGELIRIYELDLV